MDIDQTNWNHLISRALDRRGETRESIIANTLSDEDGERRFDSGFGSGEDKTAFTVWTDKYVYFPVVYDGYVWVASVPRWPSHEITQPIGYLEPEDEGRDLD